MTSTELIIGLGLPIIVMIIGYWKSEVWLFYIASIVWLVTMGFIFNNYGTDEFMYYIAWVCLALAIVCATAQLWMNQGKPNPIAPTKTDREELADHRKARSEKLANLRNMKGNLRGDRF